MDHYKMTLGFRDILKFWDQFGKRFWAQFGERIGEQFGGHFWEQFGENLCLQKATFF